MRPRWNRLPLPCCSHGCCCCGLAEGQELDLLVVGHLWGDDYSQLPDPLGFFGSVVPTAVPTVKRGQGVLFLELFNSIFGEIYDSFQLGILGHRHES